MTWIFGLGFFGAVAYYGVLIAMVLLTPEMTPEERTAWVRERVDACYRFVDTRDAAVIADAESGFFGDLEGSNQQPLFGEDYARVEFRTPRGERGTGPTTIFTTGSLTPGIDIPFTSCSVYGWELEPDHQSQLAEAVLADFTDRLPMLAEPEEWDYVSESDGVTHWNRDVVLCSHSGRPFTLTVKMQDAALERVGMRDYPDGFDTYCRGPA